MKTYLILALLLLLVVAIVLYLCRAKKRGETCIGCPYAKQCKGHCDTKGNPPYRQ